MSYTYRVREDAIHDEDRKKYMVYGIEAVDSKGKILKSFPDIFFDRREAKRFVNLCNENDLELIHLADIVEDMLV